MLLILIILNLDVAAGKSDTDNKKRGNPQKVDEFRQAELEQYLEEALFILELIGIKVFKKDQNINKQNRCKRKNAPSTHQDSLPDHTTRLESSTDDSDKLKTLQDEQDILHLPGNVFAQGKVCDDGFLVLKNSCLSVNISPSCPPSVIKMRESLLREGKVNEGIFVVDVKFASPSAAATCIKGFPVNGKKDWRYSDGKSIKEKG